LAAPRVCPTCGEKIQPSTGECLYCAAVDAADFSGARTSAPAASGPTPAPERGAQPAVAASLNPDHVFGLLLFEAEECLARGQGEKAAVLASRAVRERPGNLTARALYERSRRELLQGRRREKLEARVKEAQGLLARGELDAANRIVTSALKLVPDHTVALKLFGQIKERRHGAGTVEAEAERELERLGRLQARQALAAARAALEAGWERRALGALRRGLRMVPDDPDLLALLKQVQSAGDLLDRETAQRRAVHPQIRAGLDLLHQGRMEESLKLLRAVLADDPDNARAQAAIQEVRQAWLARAAASPAATPAPARQPVSPPVRSEAAPRPAPPPPAPVAPPPRPALRPPDRLPRRPTGTGPRSVYSTGPRTIPGEILLPRTRRRATPMRLILIGCAGVSAVIVVLFLSGRTTGPDTPPPATQAEPMATAPPVEDRGPLAGLQPDLKQAIVSILDEYQRALEGRDGPLLAHARPDLSPADRERMLARFAGALNVGVDLRVLDVQPGLAEAIVTLLRTEVVVGGRGGESAPQEETLRFEHRPEGWALGARRR
jgi:tetratricopeptide (TPR) repeat protein